MNALPWKDLPSKQVLIGMEIINTVSRTRDIINVNKKCGYAELWQCEMGWRWDIFIDNQHIYCSTRYRFRSESIEEADLNIEKLGIKLVDDKFKWAT